MNCIFFRYSFLNTHKTKSKVESTNCKVNYTISINEGVVILLGNRVKEYRARHDLTQGKLADKVGVTRQTIVSLEKGSYVPSLLLAMNIAELFNEPIEKIFYKKEEE